jgi:GT2 family glycosyltransferase
MNLHRYARDVDIVLVNDASTQEDCEKGVAWWQSIRPNIKYYKNLENIGFGGSMNIGAKIAMHHGAEALIFLSNDVIIIGDFLSQIEKKLSNDVLIGGELIYWDSGWNTFEYEGKKYILPYANGWLVACTTEVWRKIGGFDPIYGFYDYEDIDLSTKATLLGYNIVALNNPNLKHIGGATIAKVNPDRAKNTEENRQKYLNKWQPYFKEIIEHLEIKK